MRKPRSPNKNKLSIADQYWSKVIRTDDDSCWGWSGYVAPTGYGMFSRREFRAGTRRVYAHRVSYEVNVGEIPDGMSVLHTCDNRICTNPKHLYLGTQKDNIRDMFERGRNPLRPRGESHIWSKLTESDVLKILSDSRSAARVAADYGVAKSVVVNIRAGKSWRHVSRPT